MEPNENARRIETIRKDRFIYVNSDYKLVQICLDDILFIMGQKDYVRFFLDGGKKSVLCLMNMKRLEEFLPREEFKRVHRSYIVNMAKVRLIDRFRLAFGDTFIPISDTYKEEIQDYIDAHTLQ